MLILPWRFQGAPFIFMIAPLRASILNLFLRFPNQCICVILFMGIGKHFGAYLFLFFYKYNKVCQFDNLLIFI